LIDFSRLLRTLSLFKDTKKKRPARDENPHVDYSEGQWHKDRTYESGNFVSYYSDKRVDFFVSILIVTVGITMLITPIWVLPALQNATMKLVVITVFVCFPDN
jgi:NADH:ubiquinone oxidoreductase subunit 3 (subunit A)